MTDERSRDSRGQRGRRALGRGLDVLLPSMENVGQLEIDIDRVEPNPGQPRQHFDPGLLQELAASIREHGLVQPLVVSAAGDDRFRIVVGERRWRAAQIAGLTRLPAVVKDVTDRQTLEIALVENVQRSDLNPLEEAEAYRRLIDDFGLTQQEVADQVGKSRVAVTNTLRLLALPDALKRAVIEGRVSEGHARALLGIQDVSLQRRLLTEVESRGLTVRQTEELVRRALTESVPREGSRVDPDIAALEGRLRSALGTKVLLRHGKRGGRIVIEYYSDEEFETLFDRLTAGS